MNIPGKEQTKIKSGMKNKNSQLLFMTFFLFHITFSRLGAGFEPLWHESQVLDQLWDLEIVHEVRTPLQIGLVGQEYDGETPVVGERALGVNVLLPLRDSRYAVVVGVVKQNKRANSP